MATGSHAALVATKLTAPALPGGLVDRSRLNEILDRAVADPVARIVLVSAPAGSGKSTLIAGWQKGRDDGAWMQSDQADRDPARFWGHVVAALASVVPGIEAAVRPALAGVSGDAGPMLERIANELIGAPPVTLVIDDYHLIASPAIDEALERFIELTPPSLLLILSTRMDPSLRLSRLRVRSQLVEIRAETLRFDTDEARLLLHDGEVTERQAAALCERTEGWAAGLVLAGLSLKDSPDRDAFVAAFQGDDRLVVDYLTDEYLAGIEPGDRDRMLRTAVADQMSGPLIDAVCGTDDGTQWLSEIAAMNQLVIGLDNTGTTFRYHHLLRDLLLVEAERQIPDSLADLHLRAAAWHRAHGDLFRAIDHYIAGGDLETAGDLIAVHATKLLDHGQIFTVLAMLERLGDLPERHSRSAGTKGWLNFSTGRFSTARHYYDVAAKYDDGTDANLVAALGIMVNLAEGDLPTALSLAETMTEPTESTQAVGLAAVHTWAGQFDIARHHISVARELGAAEPSGYSLALAPGWAAVVELEAGNTSAAAQHAATGVENATAHGIADTPQLSLAHAIVARTSLDAAERRTAAARAVDLIRRAPEPFTFGYVLAIVGDAACENEDPVGPELLREARAALDACSDAGIAGRTLARIEARHGLADRSAARSANVEELTEREMAVLHYLPSPQSQRDIANELFVSLNTVKTHCKAIYRKLGVGDRKAAVQAARDAGLI